MMLSSNSINDQLNKRVPARFRISRWSLSDCLPPALRPVDNLVSQLAMIAELLAYAAVVHASATML
jgi:hypothetical protein